MPLLSQKTALESLTLPPVVRRPWRFRKFPIIAWWGPPGTAKPDDFRAYRDAGFNLYAANPDTGYEQAMEKAAHAGLSIMPYRQPQGFELPPHPADYSRHRDRIVGWITNDEPSGDAGVTAAITAVNTLMREDPTRWALFNMLPPGAQQNPSTEPVISAAVRGGLPVLSYDSYVIHNDGTDATEAHFRNLNQFRKASLRYDVPFWMFALSIQHFSYRRPSESDLRWQQYTNLAYGAKGIWYFTYWGPTDWPDWDKIAIVDPRNGAPTDNYGYIQTLNRQIAAMGDLLLGLFCREVMHTIPPPGQDPFTPHRQWIGEITAADALIGFFNDNEGKQYALVVNKQHGKNKSARETTDEIELRFAPTVRGVTAVNWLDGKAGPLKLQGQSATLTVAGGTGVLLRLDR